MKKIEWVQVQDFDLGAVFAKEGFKAGDLAVKLEYGFATGTTPGIHSRTGQNAHLELGKLDENLKFEETKNIYEGIDMPMESQFEINWEKIIELVDAFYTNYS